MKRLWLLGIAAAAAIALCGSASARCLERDAFCVDTNDPNAGSGNPLADVTGELPGQGIVGAGTDPGYLFWDGDSTNDYPLAGYLGLNANDTALLSGTAERARFRRDGGNMSPPALPDFQQLGIPPLSVPDLGIPLPSLPMP